MKTLKYFVSIFAILAFAGCTDEPVNTFWPELRVSNSYVNMDLSTEDGSAVTAQVTLTAESDWSIDFYYSDSEDDGFEPWLSASPASGSAGEYTITITAQPAPADRSAEMHIRVSDGDDDPANDKIQYVHIEQRFVSTEATLATVADVLNGADGTIYIVEGTVTSISNTEYGNWYLEDETGSLYIYGTLDANGAEQNFESLGIAVGDVVRVRGPKDTYNGTVELVDVTVLNIEKALVAVDPSEVELDAAAGEFTVDVTVSGDDIQTDIDADWIRFAGMSSSTMTFAYDENTGSTPREAVITLVSTQGEDSSTVTITVTQNPVTSTYTRASAITSGSNYIMVADGFAAEAVAEDDNYGYLNGFEVTPEDDKVTLSNVFCGFVFTETEGGYTIQDYYGRYYYMSGTFNSFNVTDTPEEGYVWTVEIQSDGSALITNTSTGKFVQFDSEHGSYGAYSDERGSLPVLYVKENE